MTPFQPPTDNLYKFMAVSGIVLIIAGFFVPPVFFLQAGMEYLTQLRGSDELKVQRKFTAERLETLKLRGDRAKEELKRLGELKVPSNSAEADKLESRKKEAEHEIESIEDASHELSLNLALKQAQTDYEEMVSFNRRLSARMFVLGGWIVGLMGFFFSFIGFRRWYKRLQKFQDRLVAKEAEEKLAAANTANNPIDQKPVIDAPEVIPAKPTPPTQVNLPQATK